MTTDTSDRLREAIINYHATSSAAHADALNEVIESVCGELEALRLAAAKAELCRQRGLPPSSGCYCGPEGCADAACPAASSAPRAQEPVALAMPTEDEIDEYLSDYEMRGEDEAGRDGSYTPTEAEKFIIKDAILGLLADCQPAPRAPLTNEQILSAIRTIGLPRPMGLTRDVGPYEVTEPTYYLQMLVRAIERAHGISREGGAA